MGAVPITEPYARSSKQLVTPSKRSQLLIRMLVPERRIILEMADESRILVLLLRPLVQRRSPLENAHVVEKELAVQMIDLVLQAAPEQLVGFDFKISAVDVERPYFHAHRPL